MSQAQTVTVAVTDIQGSTELWERLGHGFAAALAEHNRLIRETLARHGGSETRTEGDSFVAVFHEPARALRFALDAQKALHAHPWPAAVGELRVRIGVHTGEAFDLAGASAGRPAFSGPAVSVAHAVAAAAHGGQILLSGPARDAAGPADDAAIADLGEHALPGGGPPVRLWEALPRSLGTRRFPPPRTATARLTNLPPEKNRFIGRGVEIGTLAALLPTPAGRLVTVTGPGGIGKTRFAAHAAAALLPRFPGGVWFADVSGARAAADVARAVAEALGVPIPGREAPETAVAGMLEFRRPLLLLLDGFESATPHAAATVGLWSRRARDARFLVTSRVLLRIAGEREFPLGPLQAPARRPAGGTRRLPKPAELAALEAVRLFVDRAREVVPEFDVGDANVAEVAELCARLEGIPLALELAAARLRDLPLGGILAGLDRRLQGPDAGAPGDALAGTIGWATEALADWERAAFEQVCAFQGGFFLESAEETVDLAAFPDAPLAMDAVQSLRDRSLLRTWDTPWGTRFAMYQPIRDTGERALARDPAAAAALHARHARHFAALGDAQRARARGRDAADAIERLGLEEENFLQAIAWGLSPGGDLGAAARAALAWGESVLLRGPLDAFVAPAEAILARSPEPPALAARLAVQASRARWATGDFDRALAHAVAAVRSARAAGSPSEIALARGWEARLLAPAGRMEEAAAAFAEALLAAQSARDRFAEQQVLGHRATLHIMRHDWPNARRDLEDAIALARELGHAPSLGKALANLGIVHRQQGRLEQALASYAEAGRIFRAHHNVNDLAATVINSGVASFDLGDLEACRRLFTEARELFREVGNRAQLASVAANFGALAALEGNRGQALEMFDEAIALHRDMNDVAQTASALRHRAGLLLVAGRLQDCLAACEEAIALDRKVGGNAELAVALRIRALALARQGKASEAVEPLREAGEILADSVAHDRLAAFGLFAARAIVARQLGDGEEARRWAAKGVEAGKAFTKPDRYHVEGFEEQMAELGEILRG